MNTHTTTEPGTKKGGGCCGQADSADLPEPCPGDDRRTKRAPCGCGGPPETTCDSYCDLDCLERPLFTAEMVLSDTDLTASVDWTRSRLALQRYRDGWGVVCGLDVHCDPDHPGHVVVEPGYAVGCCGEDIVLCEAQCFDLSGYCCVESPCPDSTKEPRPSTEGSEKGRHPCGDFVVDLTLTPHDSPAVPDLVESCGCTCGGTDSGCRDQRIVPTRMQEGALIEATRVAFPAADPGSAAAELAQAAYSKCHAVVRHYVEAGAKTAARDEVILWLRMQKLDPPCDWWAKICAALETAKKPEEVDAAVAAALFQLVIDCRQRLLRRVCSPCPTEQVGLARVWLRRAEGKHRPTCIVTLVDAYPPHRRELAPTIGPVPPGSEDLAPFIWQRWEQVCGRWRKLAPNGTPAWEKFPETTVELLELFEETERLWWPCQEDAPTPVVVATPCLGDRIVGFRRRLYGGSREGSTPAAPEPAYGYAADDPASYEMVEDADSSFDPDLEKVKGVGESTADKLRATGITTIEELSVADPELLRKILGPRFNVQLIHDDAVRLVQGSS